MGDPITIAIDATGGYGAPTAVVEAVGEISRSGASQVYYALVGPHERIAELLVKTRHNPERITVVPADDAVSRACELVGTGEADAVVSASMPGSVVRAAREWLEMLPGVRRAALATVYPTWDEQGTERFSLILDVGAALRVSAEDLVQFAQMGAAYATVVTGHERPTVGLLNISSERTEGPEEVIEASKLLEQTDLDYVGPVEGQQIPRGGIDVIVCEGFAGEVMFKMLEGFADAAFEMAENAYHRRFAYRMGLRLLSPGLKKIRRLVAFDQYGGAPLLGFDKVVIVADPKSSPKAIANAIKLATKNVRADLTTEIAATAND